MIYRFGSFAVDASTFELSKGGETIHVEPQVLSVILHLIENRDHVVTRDDLVDAVWQGRIVSDAAIASRIKSARHALEDSGSEQRVIRTVHGRGFRFVAPVEEVELANAEAATTNSERARAATPATGVWTGSRRGLLIGGCVASAAVVAGIVAWRKERRPEADIPEKVAPLVFKAREAMAQNTRAGQFQAIGLFRRVVQILPGYADGWGMLGVAYGIPSHYSERPVALDLRKRGEAAAHRAFALDRGNGMGELALGVLTPFVGEYYTRREHMRRAVAALPGNDEALTYQAVSMQFDGFPSQAVAVYEQMDQKPMPPALYENYIRALWSAGRSEEAEAAMGDALSLYPTQWTLWFTRFNLLLYAGRSAEARAMLDDHSNWPAGIDPDYAESLNAQVRAFETRRSQDVAAAVERLRSEARHQEYEAREAIRMLSALGHIDAAFEIAQAYYFGEDFTIPDYADLGPTASPDQRQTRWLFEPVTAPMRSDPRFEPLVTRLGFTAYWDKLGIAPDYKRAMPA